MGTDLLQLGNHNIKFKKRHFNELTTEIKAKLDSTSLLNAEFLKRFALSWYSDNPRMIREIKTKRHWTFIKEDEYYPFDKEIEFDGPFGLSLTFDENKITFFNPPYRYWQWFEMNDNVHRDEWRKYMKQIVNLFGGNRVLYVADNSHHLEKYIYYKGTFDEMEIALREKYGKSKTIFQEVAKNFDNSYFIDDFKSIDWSKSEPLDDYLPEANDKSSIAFDLKTHSNKDNLKKLNFHNELLFHKLIKGKIHFYHLARIDGLLCVHTGIIGKQEELKVMLDEYAPFTFDSIKEKIENEEYGSQCDISFIIKFQGWKNINSWQDALIEFKTELIWNGLGTKGGSSCSDEEREEWFYAVDERLSMKLLLELGKKYKATGKIEIYRNNINWLEDNDDNKGRVLIYKQ